MCSVRRFWWQRRGRLVNSWFCRVLPRWKMGSLGLRRERRRMMMARVLPALRAAQRQATRTTPVTPLSLPRGALM